MNNSFELPGTYKKWTIGLIAAGVIALLYGVVALHPFEHPAHGAFSPLNKVLVCVVAK